MRIILAALVGLISLPGITLRAAGEDSASAVFFEKSIRPVLSDNCFSCHGPDKQKAGLRLDSRAAILMGGDSGPALVPGNPEESLLVRAIRYEDQPKMPPKHKLSQREIDRVISWVKLGSPWPVSRQIVRNQAAAGGLQISAKDREFWSFKPIRDPQLPSVNNAAWPCSSIDYFVLSGLETHGLQPVEPADRRALLRRATFDLIGLPPTPEEIEAFVNDVRPDAFARVIDRLLESPRYGERWARHWLDVARYGEDQAHTFQARKYPSGYRYRDWLIRALNEDMPYDRFIMEQIAGDLIDGPGRQERLAALGFFALGPVYYGDSKKFDQIDDRIDTLSRGFLGLTVACARCHDHKFDPIPTRDYYALAGVFANTDYTEIPAAPREVVDAYEHAQAAVITQRKKLDSYIREQTTQVAKAGGDKKQGAKAKQKIDDQLAPEGGRQLATLRAGLTRLEKQVPPKYPVIHSLMEAAQTKNLRVCIRGNPDNPGEEVPRHFLSGLSHSEDSFHQGSGRLELARCIASKDNPLTARVLVNRIWQHHFGKGLVRTPSNFGTLGERPTHPDLLDHLASRFIASGWSIKALHRQVMLSATYQLSSRSDAYQDAKDPENRLLGHANRRRLEVEAWRDAILAVTGQLLPAIGGPSLNLDSSANKRRTLYAAISRHDLNGLLRLFDFPDPNITSAERTVTTVPLQQLFVLNSPFMVQSGKTLARQLHERSGPDDAARIRRAFLLLYGRPATEQEVDLGLQFVSVLPQAGSSSALTAWEEYAQVLLSTDEFLFID